MTPADVVRVAKLYFKPSNRTVGEFIPTADPDRTEVPASPDLEALLKDYKTGLSVSPGEAFDPTPANIEKHLTRAKLPNGMKLVMLPKTIARRHGVGHDPAPVRRREIADRTAGRRRHDGRSADARHEEPRRASSFRTRW